MPSKITYSEAKKRFNDRKDIKLCSDGWTGWKTKSKFYDFIIKDYFFVEPAVVYRNKASHPKRGVEKSALSRRLPYEQAKKRFDDREDIKLCEEGYVAWDKKAKFYDEIEKKYWEAVPKKVYYNKSVHPNRMSKKRKERCLEKYGTICPLQSKKIKNKTKKTMLLKYGVEHFSQTDNFKLKVTDKQTERIIKETGETVSNWLAEQENPKPSATHLRQIIKNQQISIIDLKNILKNYRDNKTTLEVLGEQLFETKHYNRKPKQLSKLYKPDFKLSDMVYVNVDGLYWYSEINKERRHHFDTRKEFEKAGMHLVQFYEDEIKNKPKICKSIVNNLIGKTPNKIYARKCFIEHVPHKKAKVFLENNHMMGSTNAKHVGLYFDKQLVSLLSYKEKNHICKIERFCSRIDHNIVGGFSKLLNYLEKYCLKFTTTEIHNWVDLRYGTGNHLLNKKFVKLRETLGWKWTDGKISYNRLRCRANMDERKLTQQEHADELGWFKIYDAGQRLYIKHL